MNYRSWRPNGRNIGSILTIIKNNLKLHFISVQFVRFRGNIDPSPKKENLFFNRMFISYIHLKINKQ
ncbi:hypothetical protein SPHINGO8BC_140015 [Sphingobacterium multivorum]|uniref:Uncharacterized protein n=1 Tax=Sphingobacterium multivorum TaxID=28454 RepID=A0A653Z2G2_SPHMU|nr:hypothetical protein SPHINGO8BC_140015 [Sphingobacterium multivorum]